MSPWQIGGDAAEFNTQRTSNWERQCTEMFVAYVYLLNGGLCGHCRESCGCPCEQPDRLRSCDITGEPPMMQCVCRHCGTWKAEATLLMVVHEGGCGCGRGICIVQCTASVRPGGVSGVCVCARAMYTSLCMHVQACVYDCMGNGGATLLGVPTRRSSRFCRGVDD